MNLDSHALDRHITGNYGEDQFKRTQDSCVGPHNLVFVGEEPLDYDYPETGTQKVYACRLCGDLYDRLYCQKEMRDGKCVLDLNHRGRCTTVGFYCDGCGRMRRGQPYGVYQPLMADGYREHVADFCFLCIEVRSLT
jgi:hypothetical protein